MVARMLARAVAHGTRLAALVCGLALAVEEVTWRDSSRGCARRGRTYTQALVDGSRITLRVDGTAYEYHAGGSRPPSLCERPTE